MLYSQELFSLMWFVGKYKKSVHCTNIFVTMVFYFNFFSFITTMKLVFEEEIDELASPFHPLKVCEEEVKCSR